MAKSDDDLRAAVDALQRRDVIQREAISGFGVDLEKKRAIDLTFRAPDEASATKLAEALSRSGLSPTKNASSVGSYWYVSASLAASVNWITARENVVTFVLVADQFGADYDGWGTAITEAAPHQ